MQRRRAGVIGLEGSPITSGLTVAVYIAGTANLATIYSDNGTTTRANPFTADGNGSYEYYAANGRYDEVLARTGSVFDAADTADIVLYDPDDDVLRMNYAFNGDEEVWGAGTAAAPTGWTVVGGGATVAQDATNKKFGSFGVGLTRVGTDCYLAQDVSTFPGYGGIAFFKGRTVTVFGWVRATVASRGRLAINDGVGTTSSAFHTGGSVFEFITVTRTIDASATKVEIRLSLEGGNTTVQFDAIGLTFGAKAGNFTPSAWRGRNCIVDFAVMADQTVAAGSTVYLGTAGHSATEGLVEFRVPYKCVARLMYTRAGASSGGGQSFTYTLRKNTATDTALTCAASAAQEASDTTHEVEYAAGDRVAVKLVTSAGAAVTSHRVAVEIEEIP